MSALSRMERMKEAVKKANTKTATKGDETEYYYPKRDDAGNGFAVIRFLPCKDDNDIPFVKIFRHSFEGPTGKYLIENCPTSLENPCPVCEANGVLWNTGIKANKDIASERKRKIQYYANILVVSDPKTPENEGKVFLFKFGSRIFDKIEAMYEPIPEYEGAKIPDPIDIFDPVTGADFKFKIRIVKKQTNYDSSEFSTPSSIGSSDEIAEILENVKPMNGYLDPSNFKSYEDIEKRLNVAVGNTAKFESASTPTSRASKHETDDDDDVPPMRNVKKVTKESSDDSDDSEDILDLMRKLAED